MLKRGLFYWKTAWFYTKKIRKITFRVALVVGLIWYINCLPEKLFSDSTSTVLFDANNELLGARIAGDGQWRFPESDSVPHKFEVCLLAFEDRNFYSHFGISLKGLGRAVVQNFRNGRVVSGGSTITMQLARIMRKNPPRTIGEKLIEMILATRMEIRFSKKEILNLYASHAPFGNNVVGLEAASWRYFGRGADQLSWSESATLAVLPNAPGLIYPGRNQEKLLAKRDRLLHFLYTSGKLDKMSYELALEEPLPGRPLALPQMASHLMNQLIREGNKGKLVKSTIKKNLQQSISEKLQAHSNMLAENKIFNGAVIISSVKTGAILAYVGNTEREEAEYCSRVDCITAARSTGSILKPVLYASALDAGVIAPKQLLQDIPSHFGAYTPKNYSGKFHGALPADQTLSMSLNVPMVHLLNQYGLHRFHGQLNQLGFSTIRRPARHYGLSLILGGAEVSLYDLNKVYTSMAQQLKYGKYTGIHSKQEALQKKWHQKYVLGSPAIYNTFEAMLEVRRPDIENNWRVYESSQAIAWKTGTSFGFRDAWAVGVTPDYVVAVWVGNADGEGRPGLTGANAAAPLLFDIFTSLPRSGAWFSEPQKEMLRTSICRKSGHQASNFCPETYVDYIPQAAAQTLGCPYHQQVLLDKNSGLRVNASCQSVYEMKKEIRFVLSPVVERYYKQDHPNHESLPEYMEGCESGDEKLLLAVIYPRPNSQILIPRELDGSLGKSLFEVTHKNPEATVYWHLDDEYIGLTRDLHHMEFRPTEGSHRLHLSDELGNNISLKFTCKISAYSITK
ncbi:MAG: penicillin-binding protein 1C [Bacteroidetes bacterium]|nr:MAG: penicillin-binding protein 1C [Bacteroidota bacterium]